jgi:hypothetical protein
MNMYTKLMMHIERHMYKKGQYKGSAPANKDRRGMSHFRVVKSSSDGTVRIRMYNTDIITARQDGSVLIDTKGYHTHNTTIMRLNEALHWFFEGVRVHMNKQSVFSYSQPVLNVDGKRFAYYDGINLSETGEFLTPMQAFEQKRTDKAATKALADDVKASGFKDAFKILYATTTAEDIEQGNYALFGYDWQDVLADNEQADKWKLIIARTKYERDYWSARTTGSPWKEKSDAKGCWATIMQYCKKNMYVVSRSETFVL